MRLRLRKLSYGCLLALSSSCIAADISGLMQVRYSQTDNPESWLYQGTGGYRYDDKRSGVSIGQALLNIAQDFDNGLTGHAVVNYNDDPKASIGFTQAYLKYKPLSNTRYKWQLQTGLFYPRMSLENPDIAWLSPYTYSNSAINSWLGEEIKTIGAELEISRPGRQFASAHSFNFVASVFKGNDPAGTLLAWRGFTIHDRQTSLNEVIPFADLPSFKDSPLHLQASNVRPFEEIDGRFGAYVGVHWDYFKQSQLRVYYYDNNGDPSVVNTRTGQYSWDTKFTSVAWQYKFNQQWRLITQAMIGNTAMGKNRGVDTDFSAYYVLMSYQHNAHRLSARFDDFSVTERDHWPWDPNDSDGQSWTLAWRYNLNENWQVGLEVGVLDTFVENRNLWAWPQNESQQQWQGNIQYRF